MSGILSILAGALTMPAAIQNGDLYWSNVSLLLSGETVSTAGTTITNTVTTPVSIGDPDYNNVSLLLSGDAFDKSSTPKQITRYGDVTTSTAQKKYGSSSWYYGGTSGDTQYLQLTNSDVASFGANDFTIEGWLYPTVIGSRYNTVFDSSLANGPTLHINPTGKLNLVGNATDYVTGTTTLTINNWYHFAVVKSSGIIKIYLNGVVDATFSTATTFNGPYTFTVANQPSVGRWYQGYIDDFRITKGVARYTANFVPPTAALPVDSSDPNWSNVSLLLDGELDKSPNPKAITMIGNMTSDVTTKKYGTGSMYFDGSGDYLSIPPNADLAFDADFTIELWFNSANLSGNRTLMSTAGYYVSGKNGNWTFRTSGTGVISFPQYNGQSQAGGGYDFSVPTMSTNTWYHLALVKSSNTLSVYLNGVASSTTYTNTSNINDGSNSIVYVGHNASYDNDWNGYIDDLRITKGVARYTANFTPPAAAFSSVYLDNSYSNVSLLIDGDSFDKSGVANSITRYGDVTTSATQKKYGSSSWYFDGSGDYLIAPASSNFNFGTGDFTMEMWVNSVQRGNYVRMLSGGTDGNGANNQWFLGTWPGASINVGYQNGSGYTETTFNVGTWNDGTWYHLAIVRQGANLYCYWDGALKGTWNMGANVAINTGAAGFLAGARYSNGTIVEPFKGYLDDIRVTKGVARYTANFTPPTAALPTDWTDPYWGSTVLLLDGEMDKSSTPKGITMYGNVSSNTMTKKFGTGAMYFDGSSDYLTVPASSDLELGSGNFTIELWCKISSTNLYAGLLTREGAAYGPGSIVLMVNFGTTGNVRFGFGDGGEPITSSGVTVNDNAWHHIAVVRNGNNVNLYVDGISRGSTAYSGSITATSDPWLIGSYNKFVGTRDITGYIDDLRITKGVARYTANFTPAMGALTKPLISSTTTTVIDTIPVDPNYSNVSLLLTGDDFVDYSNSRNTVTVTGNTSINTTTKKFGTGSMYFDGNGDYLSVSSSPAFNLSSGIYTVEFWVNQVSRVGEGIRIVMLGENSSTSALAIGISSSGVATVGVPAQSTIGVTTGANIIPLNTWTHFALVANGTTAAIYFNGVKVSNDVAITKPTSASQGLTIGSNPGVITGYDVAGYLNGYIDDLRITKDVARYTANFTPPTTPFPINKFVDLSPSPKALTPYGNVSSNTTTKKFGTGAMYFDGSGDYIRPAASNDFSFGTGDFTVEFWIYRISGNDVFGNGPAGVGSFGLGFGAVTGDTTKLQCGVYGYPSANTSCATTITNSTWTHVAVTRASGAIRIFLNGVKDAENTNGGVDNTSNTPSIGEIWVGGGSSFNGYIDDFRITKGVARYTANFVPPAQALPTVPYTSLLLNGDSLVDSSGNSIAITGNATINTTTKKFGTGSMYFSGSTYLTAPSAANANPGNRDFTVEMWVYPTSYSTYNYAFCNAVNGGFTLYVTGNTLKVRTYNTADLLSSATVPALNTWSHVAVVRSGTTMKIYINGTATATGTDSTNYIAGDVYVGADSSSVQAGWVGYIDDLRITNGYARYTATFTPPTAALLPLT